VSTQATAVRESQVARITASLRGLSPNVQLGALIAVGLGIVAFATGGGTDLGSNTWSEIALVLTGAVLAAAAVLMPTGGRAWGATALILFVMLSAWSAASIAWSVQPADSWVEANRTVAYVAAFGGALALARLMPGRWPALIGAVAVSSVAVCGYAFLVKVFPASLDPGDVIGRIRLPFDYANAVGQLAAMGVPACLWAGARRDGGRIPRVLAVPALGVLSLAIMLSYSRGALLIAATSLIVWFALVPLRLRAALVLVIGVAGGGVVTVWALAHHPLTHDYTTLSARTSTGHSFGLILIAMLVLQTIGGVVCAFALDRVRLAPIVRRRAGVLLIGLVALIPIAAVGAAAGSSRGLTGTISHAWSQLTSPNSGGEADVPGRLLALGSSRGRYWNEGLTVGKHALLKGVGAGGFATAHTRYYKESANLYVQHSHSYVIETFADLGLIGVALSLALLVAWAIAAARATGLDRRGPPPGVTAERIGMISLLCTVLVFGLGSAIDWTWFIPGTALPALVCAGWLAGRGPLEYDGGSARRWRTRPGAIFAVTSIVVLALLTCWLIAQPLRSANADAAGLSAITRGDTAAAFADARAAQSEDPVSVDPLFELAAFDHIAGDDGAAIAEDQKAVALQPNNPTTWLEEGELLLELGRPAQALPALYKAAQLQLSSPAAANAIARARAQLGQN
jgi:tetratricopeptide (TPR) repeat protein